MEPTLWIIKKILLEAQDAHVAAVGQDALSRPWSSGRSGWKRKALAAPQFVSPGHTEGSAAVFPALGCLCLPVLSTPTHSQHFGPFLSHQVLHCNHEILKGVRDMSSPSLHLQTKYSPHISF